MTAEADGTIEILVVDDHPDQLLAIDAILAPLGQRVVHANSGEEALRLLLKRDFAVILLDVRMSGMSGLETAKLIKGRERTRFIPIIFITGMDNKGEAVVARAYSAGAVDYVLKPFQPEVLRAKVSVFVELHRQQQRLAAQERRLRQSERQQLELQHTRELLQSEAKYREILAAALDAIVICDGDGRITLLNHAAEQMFGVTEAETIGSPVDRFFVDGADRLFSMEHCIQADRKAIDWSPGELIEPPRAYIAQRASGDQFPIETSVSCLDGTDKRTYTLIVRDVSERVHHAEELQRAMTARSRFFASMSHELRTPINAALGYNALLIDGIYGPLNEKQSEGLERSQKATRHLLELVNDVLDLSKIEAGKIDLTFEPVQIPGIIDDIFITMQPLAEQNGSTLSLEHRGEPITIISDPRRLRQILFNLMSNAIKFGHGKPIRAISRYQEERDGGKGAIIDVVDQGVGIAPEDRERIFKEFEQLADSSGQPGTGLGLAISRRLAEALGGSIDVESERGKGSTFRLMLPARARVANGQPTAA